MSSSIFRKRWSGFRWISVDDEETDAGSWHWKWNAWGIQSLWQEWRRTDKVISTTGFKFTLPRSQGLSSYRPPRSPGNEVEFTLRWRNLKTAFSLWRRIKCFSSTLRQRNLNTAFSLWKRVECALPHTTMEKFENAAITSQFGFLFEENTVRETTWL